MKKIILVTILVMCIIFSLVGCSSGISQEAYNAVVSERDALKSQLDDIGVDTSNVPVDTSDVPVDTSDIPIFEADATALQGDSEKFDESTVLEQISVEEFTYSPRGWYYAFLVLKNNSTFDISVTADADFFDAAGNLVGTKSADQKAFEAGSEIVLYFMPDEEFENMEYKLSVSEEDYFECATSDLSYEATEAKDKIILSVTNNGDEPAEFAEGSVLFFNGDKVVGFDRTYFTDDDYEIKSGKTIKKELNCYNKFDSYRIFLTGRR